MNEPSNQAINDLATILMDEWQRADPNSGVATNMTSYVATFADMARTALKAGYITQHVRIEQVVQTSLEAVAAQCDQLSTGRALEDEYLGIVTSRNLVDPQKIATAIRALKNDPITMAKIIQDCEIDNTSPEAYLDFQEVSQHQMDALIDRLAYRFGIGKGQFLDLDATEDKT